MITRTSVSKTFVGFKKVPITRRLLLNKYSKAARPERILVTGSLGQIGTELIPLLKSRGHHIVATDVRPMPSDLKPKFQDIKYGYLDASNESDLRRIIIDNDITCILHMAAKLSAVAEKDPFGSFPVNSRAVENVLEISRQYKLKVFAPSSIAAFGPTTPNLSKIVDDITIQRPLNVYGVGKVYLETLGEWYAYRYGVDFRSLRYPGILSSDTLPGGGTTDYAIEMFYAALENAQNTSEDSVVFDCGVGPTRRLPMMFMPDCLKSTVQFIEAEKESLKQGTYNVAAMSFTPEELASTLNEIIIKEKPTLPMTAKPVKMNYKLDIRDSIAETWPAELNDVNARRDWNWSHQYGIEEMSREMLTKISQKLASERNL